MEPSRELDALVAEHIMGWDDIHYMPGGNIPFGRPDDDYRRDFPEAAYSRSILPYSTDIAAAWQVVEKLADMGYVVSACWGPGRDGQRYASIQMQLDIALTADLAFRNLGDMDAVAETVPLAICLAALKVFDVEVEVKPGRELDAEVAMHVMGYECVCEEEPADCPIHAYDDCDTLRAYSTDVAAAFAVDEPGWLWEFKEMPETLTVILYTSPALRHNAFVMYPILPKEVILVRREWLEDKARTYAWLRCLAALEAVGVEDA